MYLVVGFLAPGNQMPDRLESIILKIIGKKIYNPPSHLQSIIPENYRFLPIIQANYRQKSIIFENNRL